MRPRDLVLKDTGPLSPHLTVMTLREAPLQILIVFWYYNLVAHATNIWVEEVRCKNFLPSSQVRKTADPFTCVPPLLKITTKQEEKIKSIDVGRESNARRLPPSHHISTMGHCHERAVGSGSRTSPLPSRIDASRTTEGMGPRLWNTPLVALGV